MNDRTFLDVDDSILSRNLMLVDGLHDNDNDGIAKQFDSQSFIIIQPIPGACIKAKTDTGEKVFLNICTSDKIPAPEDISDTRLFELLSEDSPTFTIPMSLGCERLESDKGGLPCATYDIVINNSYYEKCQKNKSFWKFTISVIMDGISNKFDKTLSIVDYVVLKNKKVLGKLQPHRIQNRELRNEKPNPKLLIEEITSPYKDIPQKKTNVPQSTDESKLKHMLLRQPKEGTPIRLIGLFEIPPGITSDKTEVLLNSERIVVNIDKIGLVHDVWFPYTIKQDSAQCFLVEEHGVLRLNVSVENDLENNKA